MNSSDVVLSVSIKADQFLTSKFNESYADAFVSGDVKPLEDLLRKEVFTKLREPLVNADKPQQANEQNKDDLREKIYVPPRDAQRDPHENPYVFPRIGGADLDPLNRGQGGGMLYDPFNPTRGPSLPNRDPMAPRLPPGAVPPGARYDPFGPPLPNPFPKGNGKTGGYVVTFFSCFSSSDSISYD